MEKTWRGVGWYRQGDAELRDSAEPVVNICGGLTSVSVYPEWRVGVESSEERWKEGWKIP